MFEIEQSLNSTHSLWKKKSFNDKQFVTQHCRVIKTISSIKRLREIESGRPQKIQPLKVLTIRRRVCIDVAP